MITYDELNQMPDAVLEATVAAKWARLKQFRAEEEAVQNEWFRADAVLSQRRQKQATEALRASIRAELQAELNTNRVDETQTKTP